MMVHKSHHSSVVARNVFSLMKQIRSEKQEFGVSGCRRDLCKYMRFYRKVQETFIFMFILKVSAACK